MIKNTYTCPLCGSKTEDYFVSMNRDLECATDIRCANKNCFLNSNYVSFRIWTHIEDVKKNELRLQRENRMLSELIDKMALKPNQEIIEWHSYPEEKPEQPKPKYQVGDWVEVEETNQDKKTIHHVLIDRMNKLSDGTYNICFKSWYSIVFCHELTHREYDLRNADTKIKYRITRKLSPSEVVIDFGSFSGWIKRASNYNIEVYSKGNCWLANLRFDRLDPTTRSLVERLLKAQDEDK